MLHSHPEPQDDGACLVKAFPSPSGFAPDVPATLVPVLRTSAGSGGLGCNSCSRSRAWRELMSQYSVQETKQEGHLFLHLAFSLTLKVRPPHITLSSGTTANGIRFTSSSSAHAAARDTQRARDGFHQRHRIQGWQGRTPSSSLVR